MTLSYIRVLMTLLSLLLCISMYASDTPYRHLLSGSGMQHASVGVHIVDVDTREVVLSYDADRAYTPASLMKVVTAVTAMKCYDDAACWPTPVGYNGVITDTILHGDVIVKGNIDPSLGNATSQQSPHAFIDSVVDAIKQLGVRCITGRVIVDASVAPLAGWNSWLVEDLGFYYGAVCFGANYRGNEYRLYMRTAGEGSRPQVIGASMQLPDMQYHNHMTVGVEDLSEVYIMPYMPHTLLMGTLPAHRDTFALKCAMPDAPLTMAQHLRQALLSAGVEVCGEATTDYILTERGCAVPRSTHVFYTHTSDCMADMLRVMLHKSNNLYAESLLRYVALSTDSIATLSTALQTERKLLCDMGLDTLALKKTDGSGLSRKNAVTPQFLSSLLVAAYHDDELGDRFVSLLPQVGKEGTVRSLFTRNRLPGILRLKSGTMEGVLCYAGYYQEGKHTYAVVLMSNHHTCKNSTLRRSTEQFLYQILPALR